VGIGTSSPQSKLHVEGTIRVDQKIQADDAGGLELATDEGTTRVTIADNGNVGIGTSSPATALHVHRASGDCEPRIEADSGRARLIVKGTTGHSTVSFQTAAGEVGAVGYNLTGGYLFLYEGGNVALKDGKLGVNTTSPLEGLDVQTTMMVGPDGAPFSEIYEKTGTTGTSTYSGLTLPTRFTKDNTHVLSIKVFLASGSVCLQRSYYDGLYVQYNAGTGSWRLYHEDFSLHECAYKILFIRMK
jgi:hypothetical protein